MEERARITEKEYRKVETARKRSLAGLIKRSELPYAQIASATGVERRAVKRAADCEGIRYDTAVRLEYFLMDFLRNKENL